MDKAEVDTVDLGLVFQSRRAAFVRPWTSARESDAAVAALEAEVKAEVQDAYDFADQSPDPEPEELWRDVYAPVGEGR